MSNYEDGYVYVCGMVGWLAHPVPRCGKKSDYAIDSELYSNC